MRWATVVPLVSTLVLMGRAMHLEGCAQ